MARQPKHYNEQAAMKEGWLLSSRDDGYWEIQCYDDLPGMRYDRQFQQLMPAFESDADAVTYVKYQQFSPMHAEAAMLHGKKWR